MSANVGQEEAERAIAQINPALYLLSQQSRDLAQLPLGLLPEFAKLGDHMIWLCVPFSTVVSWVFLTTDRIGDWSENPFEGLPNDVPITTMSRGIERDILQLIGVEELPAPREAADSLQH